MGVRIEHILETHNHADHVSGHGRLALATGATIHVHRLAAPDYEHSAFDDRWELVLGDVVVRALHTPGHRPEHTAFALIDRARRQGQAAVSGDVIGMVVGLEDVLDAHAHVARQVQIDVGLEARIDDRRDPRLDVAHEVGRTAEIIVGHLPKQHAAKI
jgi:glyoxylase-like metal-dependent hydrolase (beta-lactamase superfamily II)